MTLIPGEEWKSMDEATRLYDAGAHAPAIASAHERIRRIRRREVELTLVGVDGRPLAGAAVEAVQQRSAFPWGDQLWGLNTLQRHGFGRSDRVRHFTRRFTDCLNAANCLSYWTEAPRNDGPKHMEFQGEDRLDGFQDQVDWALANRLVAKGHPIFWSLPKAYPEWLSRYDIETQWKFIEVRVRNLVARFKGKVAIWDVINEPMWEASPGNLPRRHWPHLEDEGAIVDYIAPVMRWAREEDPDACYVINDYGMELDPPGRELRAADGSLVTAKRQRDRFTRLFRRLRDEGVCPDALGMQSHTGGWITPGEQEAMLDDFATAGVPLHYTEFWAGTGHLEQAGLKPEVVEQMKAEYVANIITMAYAHPAVGAFFFWGGITNEMGFRNDHNSGGLPTSSNNPSPTYHRVRRLLTETWMTRERLVADADGRVRFHGFLGDYALRYRTSAGQACGVPFSVLSEGDNRRRLTLHRPA